MIKITNKMTLLDVENYSRDYKLTFLDMKINYWLWHKRKLDLLFLTSSFTPLFGPSLGQHLLRVVQKPKIKDTKTVSFRGETCTGKSGCEQAVDVAFCERS